MTFEDQNNQLGENFFQRTFGRGWKNKDNPAYLNWQGCEFILKADCNLDCKYCYLNKYGEKLYPSKLSADRKNLINNSRMVLEWMVENEYDPHMELFSGEPLIDDTSYTVLNDVLDILGPSKNKQSIVIPTNYTFLLERGRTEQLEALLEKSVRVGRPIRLSASFDGKYMEQNRPMKGDVPDLRDDAYYDSCFAFNKKWGFGYHPMVYSSDIEKWKENFLWFQKKLEQHKMPWVSIYLLEVRNKEWTNDDLYHYSEFIRFLYLYAWEKCDQNYKTFSDFLFKDKGFNILSSMFTRIGRGIGCSIQGTMFIRLGDLAVVPCHRTMYPEFIYGKLKTDGKKITGLKIDKPELMSAIYSLNASRFPYCATCVIRPLCTQGCLGSQYEELGELFTPIPTVCRMYHVKVRTAIETLKYMGVYNRIKSVCTQEKINALNEVEGLMRT